VLGGDRWPAFAEVTRRFSWSGITALAAASGNRLEALYVLAVTVGMRQGELLGLRWTDLDLDRGVLQVRARCSRHARVRHRRDEDSSVTETDRPHANSGRGATPTSH